MLENGPHIEFWIDNRAFIEAMGSEGSREDMGIAAATWLAVAAAPTALDDNEG